LTIGLIKDAESSNRIRAAAIGALNVYLAYRGSKMESDMLRLILGEVKAIETTDNSLRQLLDDTSRRIDTTLKSRK
jgi:hypothetical protein